MTCGGHSRVAGLRIAGSHYRSKLFLQPDVKFVVASGRSIAAQEALIATADVDIVSAGFALVADFRVADEARPAWRALAAKPESFRVLLQDV